MGGKGVLWALCLCLALSVSKSADLDEDCQQNGDCKVENSVCNQEYQICECDKSTHIGIEDVTDKCYPITEKLGDHCDFSGQCLHIKDINGAECVENKCVCNVHHTQKGARCYLITESIGGDCEISEQCSAHITGSVCQDAKCACNANHTYHEPKCYPVKEKLGDTCEFSDQCWRINGADCIYDRCLCNDNHIHNGSMCYPILSDIGQNPCEFHEQCPYYSHCSLAGTEENPLRTCVCNENFVKNQNSDGCLRAEIGNGGPCKENSQCLVSDTECVFLDGFRKTCECKEDFVEFGDGPMCYNMSKVLGSPCENSTGCMVDNSECSANGTCECSEDYVPYGKFDCLQKAQSVGISPCVLTAQCPLNSKCLVERGSELNTCKCDDGFVEDANYPPTACVEKDSSWGLKIGGICNATDQGCAAIANAHCKNGECACNDTFVASINNTTCLPVSTNTTLCEESVQCELKFPGSECIDFECSCNSTTHFEAADRKSCLKYANLNETCSLKKQCDTWTLDSDCIGSKCKCILDYHSYAGKCLKNIKLGQNCTETPECFLADGKSERVDCKNGICACRANFTTDLSNNKCNSSGARNSTAILFFAIAAVFAKFF